MAKKSARKHRNDERVAEREPRRIPSEEDFARASPAMRERHRGLSTVSENVLARFQQLCPACYGFYVLPGGGRYFHAYFFTEGRNAVEHFSNSDAYTELQELVIQQLEVVGRGSRDDISVEFSVEDRSMFMAK